MWNINTAKYTFNWRQSQNQNIQCDISFELKPAREKIHPFWLVIRIKIQKWNEWNVEINTLNNNHFPQKWSTMVSPKKKCRLCSRWFALLLNTITTRTHINLRIDRSLAHYCTYTRLKKKKLNVVAHSGYLTVQQND